MVSLKRGLDRSALNLITVLITDEEIGKIFEDEEFILT
jgi:hypothetical protein